jgi:SAM-dependent methyltransferase
MSPSTDSDSKEEDGVDAFDAETAAVRNRYARRPVGDRRYHPLAPWVWAARLERERALIGLLSLHGWSDLSNRRVIEVGCGGGANLMEWLCLGCRPEHLRGVELLAERHAEARHRLPLSLQVDLGDASSAQIEPGSQDVVMQSTVFSSLLDDAFQQRLADAMWRWLRPGGAVVWYDFTVDNPRNPDVRGVPLTRISTLFPHGAITARRVTLAPPISRWITRLHPGLYGVFNALPFLRTHLLCWISKP